MNSNMEPEAKRLDQRNNPRIKWLHDLVSLSPHLGGGNIMKWKLMKIISLKYSSIPLFGSCNEWLFESLSGREWNGLREHSFLSSSLEPRIFIPPKIGRNRREWN